MTDMKEGRNEWMPYNLIPGEVSGRYFYMLLSISSVNSLRMRKALEDVLVKGYSRKHACIENKVSPSNFSTKLMHLQFINQTVAMMCMYRDD